MARLIRYGDKVQLSEHLSAVPALHVSEGGAATVEFTATGPWGTETTVMEVDVHAFGEFVPSREGLYLGYRLFLGAPVFEAHHWDGSVWQQRADDFEKIYRPMTQQEKYLETHRVFFTLTEDQLEEIGIIVDMVTKL